MAYPEISNRRLAIMKITFQVMSLPAFGLGLAFLGPIFAPMLAFSDAKYSAA